ncbi:MAG: hypothetical protein AAGC55_23045, partial [Myxococcota bacterium]
MIATTRRSGPVPGWPRSARRAPLLAVALALAAGIPVATAALGCAGDEPAPVSEPAVPAIDPDDMIEKVTELGPVTATVRLSPKQPTIGDPLTLVLEVESQTGVAVEMPSFGEALGRFMITQFVPRERASDGARVATQTYTLQAPMSGRQRIPPLRVEFTAERPSAGAAGAAVTSPQPADAQNDAVGAGAGAGTATASEIKELLTEEIAVVIASVLPDGPAADTLPGERGALDAQAGSSSTTLVALLIGLVVLLGVGAVFGYRWWRRAAQRQARVSAFDVAMARLDDLERRGLPGGDDEEAGRDADDTAPSSVDSVDSGESGESGEPVEADIWYVELSAIIRRYLEDRYSLRAPELTTEEFLYIASRSGQISTSHRELLSAFLTGCDRVKFAGYVPDQAESRKSLGAARQFVEESRLVAIAPSPAAATSASGAPASADTERAGGPDEER